MANEKMMQGVDGKEVKVLGVEDSINHALFLTQSMLDILEEKGIIKEEELREKYAKYVAKFIAIKFGVADFDADEYVNEFIKGVRFDDKRP